MLYKAKTTAVKPRKRRYKLSSFKGFNADATVSYLPCDYTGDSINFGYDGGCLVGGTGLSVGYLKEPDGSRCPYPEFPLSSDEKLKLSVYYCGKQEDNFCDMLAIGKNNIYRCPASRNKMVWLMHYFATLNPNEGVNYVTREGKYVYIMRGSEKGLYVFDGKSFENIENALKISHMCVHAERVFAIVEDDYLSVWFCDAFDPYNWDISLDAGGYLKFDGSLGNVRRLFSFADYLFVFCDYGIYKVSAYGDQSAFSIRKLYSACGRIYPETIVEAGDRLIFVAEDGMYSFDGYDVTLIGKQIVAMLHDGDMGFTAAYCKRKYYLAFYCMTSENAPKRGKNNRLMELDLTNGNINLSDISVYSLRTVSSPVQNDVMAFSEGDNILCTLNSDGTYKGDAMERYWRIYGIDMNEPDTTKVVRRIESNCDTSYSVKIISDTGAQVVVDIAAGARSERADIKGKKFDIEIYCNAEKVKIKPPYLTIDFLE